ncbi:MAG TPA: hypothetical protein VJ917_01020, partial [Saprospiraceae bacterium]|nr:hypothetical protein [Saprospiraceae bacterium]
MMGRIFILACGLLTTCFLYSQKHDYNYYTTGSVLPRHHGIHFQYVDSLQDLVMDTFNLDGRISASPVMSNAEGEFLFYTNSLHVYDSIGRTAINGDSMFHGSFLEQRYMYYPHLRGWSVRNKVNFFPLSDSTFFMFSQGYEDLGSPAYDLDIVEKGYALNSFSSGLWLSVIRQNGEGRMLIKDNEKKIQLLEDYQGIEQLMSVKKKNGQDWWFMVPELLTDSIFIFSVDVSEETVRYEGKNYFSPFNARVCGTPITCVHPEGKYLVRLFNQSVEELNHLIEIFAFDRCTGKTERLFVDSIPVEGIYPSTGGDVEFSENGRFLYIALSEYVLQLDMMDDNPFENKDTIGYYEELAGENLHTNMDQMWRLPNGKILVCGLVSTSYAHYIHQPNEKGDACNFENRALIMPPNPFAPDRDNLLLTT